MTKTDQIKKLFSTTELTYQQIADQVGCRVEYVRVIQQRMLGGGESAGDKKYRPKKLLKMKEHFERRYYGDPEYRARCVERATQYQRNRYREDADYRELKKARARANYHASKQHA